ncbi:uncharacterized protein LOC141634258 [Silene latifolia]|uniref:uncharacterized protein LOC141634258 n=1 Tax=Silene latifolia TaxID=37657 RepID=UPI003D76FC9F
MEVAENTGSDVTRVSIYHKQRLYFSFTTRVDHQCTPSILYHGFRFIKFQDILDKNVSDRHYLDVIGELTGCSKVTLSKNKGEKLRTVELTDLTKTVLKCSVWGDYTDDFSFVDDWHCSEPMICIMQNVQRTTYNGEVRINTTRYATQIGYNKEILEVEEYRERNRDLPASSESRISELSHDSYDLIRPELIRTITEIVKSGKVWTNSLHVKVYSIMTINKHFFEILKIYRLAIGSLWLP